MQREQGLERAFARIADAAKALRVLEERVAAKTGSTAEQLADALRLEGAHIIADAIEGAAADGLPPHA